MGPEAYGQIIGNSAGQATTPLDDILRRINSLNDGFYDTGMQLALHADRVHGPRPPSDASANSVAPVRSGLIGEIEDALDRLSSTCTYVNEQASRATAL